MGACVLAEARHRKRWLGFRVLDRNSAIFDIQLRVSIPTASRSETLCQDAAIQDRPRRRRALNDEKIETANPTQRPRISIDGPGKPYIVFAIVASAAIIVAMVLVPILGWHFGYLSPIWVVGHACVAAGGLLMNRGHVQFGRSLIRTTCALIVISYATVLLFVGISQPFLPIFIATMMGAGPSWMVAFSILSVPIYVGGVIGVLVRTYRQSSPQSRAARGGQ